MQVDVFSLVLQCFITSTCKQVLHTACLCACVCNVKSSVNSVAALAVIGKWQQHNTQLFALFASLLFDWNRFLEMCRYQSRHSSFLTHVVCTGQNRTDRSAGRTWLFDLCSDFLFFFYFFSVLFFFFFFYFTFAENHNSYLSYLVSWNVLFCGRAVAVAIVVGKPHALIYFSYILYICVWIYKTYRAEYMYV